MNQTLEQAHDVDGAVREASPPESPHLTPAT